MGQYYKAVNIETMKWMQSNGFLKLTETAWVGNDFMQAVMKNMCPKGIWFKNRIVWAGDYYGDEGKTEKEYYALTHSSNKIPYKSIDDYSSDPAIKAKAKEAYRAATEWQKNCILVNFSRKEYVNYNHLPTCMDDWTMNPLPLLTALGNDRGGGDYRDGNPDFDKIGIWAGDQLGILQDIPYGFWELKTNFKED